MKKILFSIIPFLVLSCSQPQNYVQKAVRIMDKNGLYAEGPQWDSAKNVALQAKPETMQEAYSIVREALKVAGGKHSFLKPANRVEEDYQKEWEMPAVTVYPETNFASIRLPEFVGNENEGIRYANTVIDAVPDDIDGVVIDLRGNLGGDMYPMIASVHRFIPGSNDMLRFKSRKRTSWIPLSYVLKVARIEEKPHIDCPVAILIDSLTASSGEATLLCFRGLENVRTFGTPTAGYASSNAPYAMSDGSSLVLTVGCDVARTGEVFCDDPIAPDVLSDDPEKDALEWILTIKE